MTSLVITDKSENRTSGLSVNEISRREGDLHSRTVTRTNDIPTRDVQILHAYQVAMDKIFTTMLAGGLLINAEMIVLLSNMHPAIKVVIAVGGPIATWFGLRGLNVF